MAEAGLISWGALQRGLKPGLSKLLCGTAEAVSFPVRIEVKVKGKRAGVPAPHDQSQGRTLFRAINYWGVAKTEQIE